MAFSTNYRNKLIKECFGNVAVTQPTIWYLGLSTTEIDANGSNITEPQASVGYTRTEIPNDNTNWSTAANGIISNLLAISMSEVSTDVGKIASIFLADTENGDALVWKTIPLDQRKELQEKTTVFFDAGNLEFSLENEIV